MGFLKSPGVMGELASLPSRLAGRGEDMVSGIVGSPKSLPLLVLCCFLPFYWIAYRAPAFGMHHDDGVYLVTAKALAEGKGYRIISLPDQIRQTKYPIVFPFLLSLVWRAFPRFPENLRELQAVPMIAAALWLTLSYRFLRRWGGLESGRALWVLASTVTCFWVVFLSTLLMSDLLFGAVAVGALLALLRFDNGAASRWRGLVPAALLCSLAFHIRTAGIALVVAGACGIILRKRYRDAIVFVGLCLLLVSGWWVWQSYQGHSETHIQSYYTAENYRESTILRGPYTFSEARWIFLVNVRNVISYPLRILYVPKPEGLLFTVLYLVGGIVVWAFYSRGVFRTPKLLIVHVFIAVNIAMILVWAWEPNRFLVPFLPISLFIAYKGLPNRWPGALLAFQFTFGFLVLFGSAVRTNDDGRVGLPGGSGADWQKVTAVHDWVRANAEPGSVVLANYDPTAYLFTGHPSIRPYVIDGTNLFYKRRSDLDRKLRELKRVIDTTHARYLIETGHDDVEEPEFCHMLQLLLDEGELVTVKRFGDKYAVYAVSRPRLTSPVAADTSGAIPISYPTQLASPARNPVPPATRSALEVPQELLVAVGIHLARPDNLGAVDIRLIVNPFVQRIVSR